jgi:hypothetical protein
MKLTNITLENLGTVNKNKVMLEFSDQPNIALYFSYATIIGIVKDYQTYCLQNYWSNTTGKLLNEIEPDKSKRLEQEAFDAILATVFAGEGNENE